MKNKAINVFFTFILSSVSVFSFGNVDIAIIEGCHIDGIRSQVKCGTIDVPSNYNKVDGEKISINFAVLPAIDNTKNKTPLMFLAGGPGQAAVELAAHIRSGFTEVRKTRDIILVDQRGTGLSHPLQCDESQQAKIYSITPEDFDEKEIATCIETLQKTNDLSQHTYSWCHHSLR